MKRNLVRIAIGLIGIFIVAQLFRPELSNPPSDPSSSIRHYTGIPPEVVNKIESACFDCHSNETRWPWYSYITPVNYLIASDVNTGRRHVNFSDWNKYNPGKLKSVLDNIYDQVYNREMPLSQYKWMRSKAKLTDADVKMICDWASGEEDRLDQVSEMQSENKEQQKVTNDSTGTKK